MIRSWTHLPTNQAKAAIALKVSRYFVIDSTTEKIVSSLEFPKTGQVEELSKPSWMPKDNFTF
jgi:hypothetical protein